MIFLKLSLLCTSLLQFLQLLGFCSSQENPPRQDVMVLLLANDEGGPLARTSDGLSLNQKLKKWTTTPTKRNSDSANAVLPSSVEAFSSEGMCVNSSKDKEDLQRGIEKGLRYYESHVNQLNVVDSVVGLQVVEGMAETVGLNDSLNLGFKRTAPLIERIAKQTLRLNSRRARKGVGNTGYMYSDLKAFLALENHVFKYTATPFKGWKSWDKLEKVKSNYSIGTDPETVWPDVNAPCQLALVSRCDVPHVCRKLFLDPKPQSQYMLSHQALYVYLGIQKSCQLKHPEVFKGWEDLMEGYCAKMLGEAEFIAAHNYPDWGRDIFAEYVFICGLAGYPNFLRSDWIQEILSWQSNSDYGCFLNPGMSRYASTEVIIRRYPTLTEKLAGIKKTGESCRTHLSSVSLAALAVKLRWIHENC